MINISILPSRESAINCMCLWWAQRTEIAYGAGCGLCPLGSGYCLYLTYVWGGFPSSGQAVGCLMYLRQAQRGGLVCFGWHLLSLPLLWAPCQACVCQMAALVGRRPVIYLDTFRILHEWDICSIFRPWCVQ